MGRRDISSSRSAGASVTPASLVVLHYPTLRAPLPPSPFISSSPPRGWGWYPQSPPPSTACSTSLIDPSSRPPLGSDRLGSSGGTSSNRAMGSEARWTHTDQSATPYRVATSPAVVGRVQLAGEFNPTHPLSLSFHHSVINAPKQDVVSYINSIL